MVEVAQFTYESIENIITSDKYVLKIKALVEYEINSEDGLNTTLDQASIKFFNQLSLMESLNLLEQEEGELTKKYIQNIIDISKSKGYNVSKFSLTTIEGLAIEDLAPLNLDINPELEGKKKKKGLRGRFFGKK